MHLREILFAILGVHITGIHSDSVLDEIWHEWMRLNGKTYPGRVSEIKHKQTWERNYLRVLEHNTEKDSLFRMELNFLADETFERTPMASAKLTKDTLRFQPESDLIVSFNDILLPDSWDWRTKKAVTHVENQGQLGDSQAFAAKECVESFNFIKTTDLLLASAAEMHDCCTATGFATETVFDCVHNIGGLCEDYYYPSTYGQCRNNSCTPLAKVSGGQRLPTGDEEAMKSAVYITPVLSLVDASQVSFQLYQEGIYSDPQCSNSTVNHALQVVGYGSLNGMDYWICRNSWGTGWGMNGYINIARNRGNMCGIASFSSYPY
ncbi:uncharacterized protein LOC127865030 isoform X1 [Dreissena polymorpha]|uniref:uncharacterized protein LOC127865030 isoform X1 n=1 Tax=Dreissena polymorpha TaxID=45954 RepID=UPI002263D2D4|nr:uncharacterized protein LOC127865030 isoform X1 [Dreissena polymorpha]